MSGSTRRYGHAEQPCGLSHPSWRGRAGGKLAFWAPLAKSWLWRHPWSCSTAAVACRKAKAVGTLSPGGSCCSLQVKTVTKSSCGLLDVTVTSLVPGHKPTEGVIRDVDCLLWAVGREPNTEDLCLDRVVRWLHIPSVLMQGCPQFSGGPMDLQSLPQDGVPTMPCP